jgi:hypothetical protein
MPKFRIPVRWEMYGVKEIEAADIDEACDIAWNETKLSDVNAEYVVGSFEVDSEMLETYNPKVN